MRTLAFILMAGPALAGEPVFVDRSADLPLEHVYSGGWEHFVGGGVAVMDCDADGFPDLFAAGGEAPARLFRNATGVPGAPVTFETAELPEITRATGAYPLDINGDGWLDLFVLRVGPNMALKGGPGCRFEDATEAWGIATGDTWSTAFTATWEDGQDRPTLAIGNYVDRTDPDGPFEACDDNTLLRPGSGGYGDPVRLSPGYCALSILFSDAARRGTADLRVSNDRHYYVRGGSEQMWKMPELDILGPEDGWAAVSIWGMGIASEDITGDGLPEVVLTSMGDQLLQYATGGFGFRTAPYSTGATAHRPHIGDDGRPSTGWHAEFGDIDNDGRADIFIAKGNVDQMPTNAMRDPNSLLMQEPDGSFREASVAAGVASMHRARGAALSDLNRDGRLDIVVVNRRAPMEVWENAGETGNWVTLLPRQEGPNGFAIGGWVELRDGSGTVRTKELTVGGGHAGGEAGPVHFGLGDAARVDVRMLWPDGTASDWITLEANRHAELWRDGGRLALRAQ